jgi:hypothetical protein
VYRAVTLLGLQDFASGTDAPDVPNDKNTPVRESARQKRAISVEGLAR